MNRLRRILKRLELFLLRMSLRRLRYAVLYQPMPWIGVHDSKRAEGTVERMRAIENHVAAQGRPAAFVTDIGCNVGYFSLSFCAMGAAVFAIESDSRSLAIASAVKELHIPSGHLFPMNLLLDESNIRCLPTTDYCLCLSVWHHWVKHYGFEAATRMLQVVFAHTSVLYFDTGQEELGADYGLSHFNDDFPGHMRRYLNEKLSPSRIDVLGDFKAFSPKAKIESERTKRTLFAVVR